jgi:hypothetical protein
MPTKSINGKEQEGFLPCLVILTIGIFIVGIAIYLTFSLFGAFAGSY